MTLDDKERDTLIRYRLGQAEEAISDVELLINNNRFRAAINRIYYRMFYSLLALGLANKFETSKHSQLIGWFNKKFIKEELIDSKFGKTINKAFNRRTKSDYDTYAEFDNDIVMNMFTEMKEFISEIKRFVNIK